MVESSSDEVNFKTNLDPERVRKLIDALRNVYDPEIPIDVYDLGLIYEVMLEGDKVVIKMTLTAVGCPLSQDLGYSVGGSIQSIVPEAKDVDVEVVFDPPWTPLRMTKVGREMFKAIYGYDIVDQWLQQQAQEQQVQQ
ncbi:hypothetical protein GCM10007981_05630 [Thermocladium modestius]|uniref:MIP18 family-like domain-containing protein n=1 Tax=Thermocladium modestius TaxID=62609 RepID=A0A830GWW8_9CREN|nr:metal-sulfur cluster assembly factor [Thermocladium modestius]GGP19936.1 hypothetical protein GCM10007981_05630 [Thermocladium modestius]